MTALKSPTQSKFSKFIQNKQTKSVPFSGEEIEIRKLSLKEMRHVQELAKDTSTEDEASMYEMLRKIISLGIGEDFPQDVMEEISLGDLNELSNAIMEYSGAAPQK